MALLNNYIMVFYKKYLREAVRLATTYALANSRIAQNRLLQCETGLEGVAAKIVRFDRTLAPDEEDGAALTRYRSTVGESSSFRRFYTSFIKDKDKEALAIIERGKDYLGEIRKGFEEVVENPMENVKSVLKSIHSFKEKTRTLASVLRMQAKNMQQFLDLLNQLLNIEKES